MLELSRLPNQLRTVLLLTGCHFYRCVAQEIELRRANRLNGYRTHLRSFHTKSSSDKLPISINTPRPHPARFFGSGGVRARGLQPDLEDLKWVL
jgi:hypothetical protein